MFFRTCRRNRSLGNLCNFLFTTGIVQLNVSYSSIFQNVLFMCSLVTPWSFIFEHLLSGSSLFFPELIHFNKRSPKQNLPDAHRITVTKWEQSLSAVPLCRAFLSGYQLGLSHYRVHFCSSTYS